MARGLVPRGAWRPVAGLTMAVVSACAAACAPHPGPTREIVLVARGMSFIQQGAEGTPNPVLTLRAGERVRLVLENQAPGLLHDFAIPAWDVEMAPLRAGEQRDVVFVVPDTPGQVDYHCRPHAGMMHGVVEVVP